MKILRCKCTHRWQDAICGRGLRFHNQTRKSNGTVYRCTVCETENIAK